MAELKDDLDCYPIAESGDLFDQLPVIDVSTVVSDAEAPEAKEAVHAIAQACREWGFFQVINHGVSQSLIDAVWQKTRHFFDQPTPVKEAVMRTRENPWGYYNNELTKNQRDKKEVFDYTTGGRDSIYASENRWPSADPRFRLTMCTYRDAVTGLGLALLRGFCVGLDLPAEFMQADFGDDHTGFVRLNYYPVHDPLADTSMVHLPVADLGVHHHTDAGALTILLQDEVGGLQVFKGGYWYNVEPLPGAFFVNTGDMMQVWSNDIYQAAVHRVLAMDHRDRFSIPFFFNPRGDAKVSPLPSVVSPEHPARYRIINWAEFRGKRTDGDYADYGPEVQIAQYRI